MKTTTKAHIAVLLTNLFFAANYSFVKIISPSLVKPFALNVFRVGFSLVLFWGLWLLQRPAARIQKQHWPRFVLCSITGVAINQMFFIKGLTLTSTIHASLLALTTPLLISIFALWVLKEPLTVYKIAGLLLGIGGSVLLVLQKENKVHAQNYLLGDVLVLINAISYTIYFILVKPLMEVYRPLQIMRWMFTFGLVLILPFSWHELQQVNLYAFDAAHAAALFCVAFTGTFLAYVFNAYGIQHLGAGITGAYIYTQPVFAILIAALFLSEALNGHKVTAALLIFAGVYLVSFKRKKSNLN